MDARIAAELLYESEATLRMVDTVLDELHAGDHEAESADITVRGDYPRNRKIGGPSEFCVRGYWHVQELLEYVKQARGVIDPDSQTELELHSSESNGRADTVLALVDSLESLNDGSGASTDMLHTLRSELHALLGSPSASRAPQANTALHLLAEAEAGLTRLGHMFEDADAAA